ncbi:hypothetical protein ASC75_23855 [Aminobacter sp. DSM 101952]|nr:hypothetical protein ASC75_23855 [Aminobacter sp. DSM 101952]
MILLPPRQLEASTHHGGDNHQDDTADENCTDHNVASLGQPIHRHNDRHYNCAQVKEDLPRIRIRKAKRQQAMYEGTKVSRRFARPAGLVYDWQKRRCVSANWGIFLKFTLVAIRSVAPVFRRRYRYG